MASTSNLRRAAGRIARGRIASCAPKFLDLAGALGELGAWVRLTTSIPTRMWNEVIALMADGKVLPYLDIPFQHAAPTCSSA